ncbi:MAG: gliding motility lipoprotein GldD [Mangrovibacterium sp.]
MRRLQYIWLILVALTACRETAIPKQRAFFRISFPEKSYQPTTEKLPFSFEQASYLQITQLTAPEGQTWVNLSSSENKADIHLSHEYLHKDLDAHIEEARRLAYDHSIKADAIDEQLFLNPEKQVFGIAYRIKGNAASPMQFFLTDSTHNFIRGAFYIREIPNIDSIQPVIDFYESDVIHLIETFQWTD